jgi:vitamin B12 transporter
MRKIYLFFLSVCFSVNVNAQTEITLNPLSITSNRLLQKTKESGRNITVIKGDAFNHLPSLSLDELLKYVPGIEIQSRGPMGAQSDIVIRGGTFQQTLILLDGIKINDPITGHFNSYIPIVPYEIERIEILRGPAAAQYGAEAVGGVIHIISKTFSRSLENKEKQAQLNVATGSYNLLHANAGASYHNNKFQACVGVLSNNTDGAPLRSGNAFIHNNTISISSSLALNRNWQFAIRSSYDHRDFAAQNFYTPFVSDTATEKVSTLWNQLQVNNIGKKRNQEIALVNKITNDFYLYNAVSTANENSATYTSLQYLNSSITKTKLQYSFGAQVSHKEILSNDRGNHQSYEAALFGTFYYNIYHWHIASSLRTNWDQSYGAILLPQINAAYLNQHISYRAAFGRAFRNADFTERFNNFNKALVRGGSIGNPDLSAETSWNFEIGATATVLPNVILNSTLFYRTQKDVIDWVSTNYADMPRKENLLSSGSYALAKNIQQVTTRGMEINLQYHKVLPKQLWDIQAGLSLLNSESNSPTPSFYIISHAKILAQSSIAYQYKSWQCSVQLLYKERNTLEAPAIQASISKDYFVANARLGFQISKHIGLYTQCNNVLDNIYSDLLGSQMPGRWISMGINSKF